MHDHDSITFPMFDCSDNYAAALNWLIDNQNGIGINLSLSDSAVSPTSSGLRRQATNLNVSLPT